MDKHEGSERRVLVCGGRDLIPHETSVEFVRGLLAVLGATSVVHGGANGGDRIGELAGKAAGIKIERYPADWTKYGRAAGPIRNEQMACSGLYAAIALPGGKGTDDMTWRCDKKGIPVTKVTMQHLHPTYRSHKS